MGLLQFFSNLLGKGVDVSENDPLPVVATTATVPFDPGAPISETNPLPIVVS